MNLKYESKFNKNKQTSVYVSVCLFLLIILCISIVASVAFGSTNINPSNVYKVIGFKLFGIGDFNMLSKGAIHDVVWYIRMPRVILAIGVGMGLSVCGVVMQAVVKNPLADPYVLGVSSGASLGATIAIFLGVGSIFGNNAVGICAFLGALSVSILVLKLSSISRDSGSIKLILSGMALSYLCSAFSSFIVYMSNDAQGMKDITFWLMGSLAGAKWEDIAFVLPMIFIGTIFFALQYRVLNLMLLGDEVAITLGRNLTIYRTIYLTVSSILIGLVVYSSGMIGFVGLVIPHIVRMLFGTDHKKIVLISALLGAIFLVWSDVLSRVIIPNAEIPIGILVSMIGAPCFVWMMIKKSYDFGGNN